MIPPQYFLGSLYYVFSVSTIDPLSEHCLLTPSMGSLLAHHYLLVTISVNMAGITNLGVGIAPSITSSYAGLEWPPKILEIILRCRSLPTDNRFFSFFFQDKPSFWYQEGTCIDTLIQCSYRRHRFSKRTHAYRGDVTSASPLVNLVYFLGGNFYLVGYQRG